VRIREITGDDWRIWREMRLAAMVEAPYAFYPRYADWRNAPEERWRERLAAGAVNLLAELDGAPAGMMSGRWADDEPTRPGTVDVYSVWVAPPARGRGVGDALLTVLLDWSARAGASRARLRVFAGNDHAIALYRRAGFAPTGAVEKLPGDDRVDRTMELSLLDRPAASVDQRAD
jgi:ribosomal protein S18 acetylase RimI-like enzyme